MKRRRKKEPPPRQPAPWAESALEAINRKRSEVSRLESEIEESESLVLSAAVEKGLPGVITSGIYDGLYWECPDERNDLAFCIYDVEPPDEFDNDERCLFCGAPKERK